MAVDTGDLGYVIMTAAAMLCGAIRWAAGVMAKSINGHSKVVEANTEALKLNTAKAATVMLMLFGFFILAGCAATDPMIIRAMERDRQIWEEDRRLDLDPELIKSRNAEFDAHENYARAGDDE